MDRGTGRGPYRSRAFLAWAKRHAAPCAICREHPGTELHHYGPHGMSQKGSDLIVAHVCRECHGKIQGMTLGSARWVLNHRIAELADLQADTIALLAGYVQELEGDPKRPRVHERPPRCAGCAHLEDGMCGACWPHHEPPLTCAREDLLGWVADHVAAEEADAAVAWLLAWANRRAANVLDPLVEALQHVAAAAAESEKDQTHGVWALHDLGREAADALRRAGFPVLPKEGT